uniref:Uncharacterized protein n=1 Tax=Arundo donax TaxID=35708 RepID=A0A0A9GSE0_ARUDO
MSSELCAVGVFKRETSTKRAAFIVSMLQAIISHFYNVTFPTFRSVQTTIPFIIVGL